MTNVTAIRSDPERTSWADLPQWVPADRWADWCEWRAELHRLDRRIPWGPATERASLRQLERLVRGGAKVTQLIDDAIAYGWRGFWAE